MRAGVGSVSGVVGLRSDSVIGEELAEGNLAEGCGGRT